MAAAQESLEAGQSSKADELLNPSPLSCCTTKADNLPISCAVNVVLKVIAWHSTQQHGLTHLRWVTLVHPPSPIGGNA
jgi:hypothetical protein